MIGRWLPALQLIVFFYGFSFLGGGGGSPRKRIKTKIQNSGITFQSEKSHDGSKKGWWFYEFQRDCFFYYLQWSASICSDLFSDFAFHQISLVIYSFHYLATQELFWLLEFVILFCYCLQHSQVHLSPEVPASWNFKGQSSHKVNRKKIH